MLGTPEERGMLKWKKQMSSDTADDKRRRQRVYDLPYVTDFLFRHKFFHYIPFLPSFRAFRHTKDNSKDTKEWKSQRNPYPGIWIHTVYRASSFSWFYNLCVNQMRGIFLGFNENIRSNLCQSCGTMLLVKLIKFMFSNFRSIIIASNYSLFSPLDTN